MFSIQFRNSLNSNNQPPLTIIGEVAVSLKTIFEGGKVLDLSCFPAPNSFT